MITFIMLLVHMIISISLTDLQQDCKIGASPALLLELRILYFGSKSCSCIMRATPRSNLPCLLINTSSSTSHILTQFFSAASMKPKKAESLFLPALTSAAELQFAHFKTQIMVRSMKIGQKSGKRPLKFTQNASTNANLLPTSQVETSISPVSKRSAL